MKSNEFKQLMKHVETCERNNEIWWLGWVFMDLTERQMRQLYNTLLSRPDFKETIFNGKWGVKLPSSIFLENPTTYGRWYLNSEKTYF